LGIRLDDPKTCSIVHLSEHLQTPFQPSLLVNSNSIPR